MDGRIALAVASQELQPHSSKAVGQRIEFSNTSESRTVENAMCDIKNGSEQGDLLK